MTVSIERNVRCLRLFIQWLGILELISFIVSGMAPLAVAQGASSPASRTSSQSVADQVRRIRNIVLVHGAWLDGSGWKGVYEILVNDGYSVTIVQEPETSFKEDVAATRRALAQQNGPCVLVGHSYGGP